MKIFEPVLNKMLSFDPKLRPSATELIEEFRIIRKKLNPNW